MAREGRLDEAISLLREGLLNLGKDDYMAVTNIHLLIAEFEKQRAVTRQEAIPKEQAVQDIDERTIKLLRSAEEGWLDARRLLADGNPTVAIHKLLNVKRVFSKLDMKDKEEEIEEAIEKARKKMKSGSFLSDSSFQVVGGSTMNPAVSDQPSFVLETPSLKENNETVPARLSRIPPQKVNMKKTLIGSIKPVKAAGLASILKKAKEKQDEGDLTGALRLLESILARASMEDRPRVERQIRQVETIIQMKNKMEGSLGINPSGFVNIHETTDVIEGANNEREERDGFKTHYAGQTLEEKEWLGKRELAEKLIVEAENTENIDEAIEKLQDAAHLLLVTRSRQDRVEYIYEKINTLKKTGHAKKFELFQNVIFDPVALREYAFQRIDMARNESDYGHYTNAIELYKYAIKALFKAGWNQEQMNYIINDMISARKKLDLIEKEEDALFEDIFMETAGMLEYIDVWRQSNGDIMYPEGESFDEDIHVPGREKSLLEKEFEKMSALQRHRSNLQEQIFKYLEDAKLKINSGSLKEALKYYEASIKIMDRIGGWGQQKAIIQEEIRYLRDFIANREEVLQIQESALASTINPGLVEERTFLINKAALIHQEELKEKLILKRARQESEKMVFDFLIPIANTLKKQGRLAEALVEFNEALKLLTNAGWTTQAQALRDEIALLEKQVMGKETLHEDLNEQLDLQASIFDEIIPAAKKALMKGELEEAMGLYQIAVEKLLSIGWENYISPLLAEIEKIKLMIEGEGERTVAISEKERIKESTEHVELAMRFIAMDMKEYALIEFEKAIPILESLDDAEFLEDIRKQLKMLQLEITLEESQRILLNRKT